MDLTACFQAFSLVLNPVELNRSVMDLWIPWMQGPFFLDEILFLFTLPSAIYKQHLVSFKKRVMYQIGNREHAT